MHQRRTMICDSILWSEGEEASENVRKKTSRRTWREDNNLEDLVIEGRIIRFIKIGHKEMGYDNVSWIQQAQDKFQMTGSWEQSKHQASWLKRYLFWLVQYLGGRRNTDYPD
jgi:hypothetical protein